MARDLWDSAIPADAQHSYLASKALTTSGVRQHGDTLLVPMVDAGFRLWNVQRIDPAGRKRFLTGGRTEGLFWPHGVHSMDGRPSDGPLVIGEGYATMAAIHVGTGLGVAAAMSARNLEAVARNLRKLFPDRALVIAADDDSHLPDNIGVGAATAAAEAVGGLLATPLPIVLKTRSADSGIDFADIPRSLVAARIAAAAPVGRVNE